MEVDVDDAPDRNHPAQVKVKDVDTIEEVLIDARKDHIRHCGELYRELSGIMRVQLEGIIPYLNEDKRIICDGWAGLMNTCFVFC